MIRIKLNLRKVAIIAICLAGSATLFAQETGVVINGVTWATRNVGAPKTFVANIEDAGMFYQWNSKIGWTKELAPSDGASVWNSEWNGSGATSWEADNDPCPNSWRVPTAEDFGKLVATGGTFTTTPVNGFRFGSGDNTLFISVVAGYIDKSYNYGAENLQSLFWSSTSSYSETAVGYYFTANQHKGFEDGSRSHGFCVRCVKAETNSINAISTETENATITGYFDVLGRKQKEEPMKGFYIIQYDNGKTKKMMK